MPMTTAELRRERRQRGAGHPRPSARARRCRRAFDERRQRALTRYYAAAGAGGLAVGVHTTQFAIRDPRRRPVRAGPRARAPRKWTAPIAARTSRSSASAASAARPPRRCAEAETCCVTLAITPACSASPRCATPTTPTLIAHCTRVADATARSSASTCSPPSAAGRCRTRSGVASPKSPPSSPSRLRRSTATRRSTSSGRVADSGRDDIALYTGNDDNIVGDLITPFRFDDGTGEPSNGGSSAGCSGTGPSGRAAQSRCSTNVRLPSSAGRCRPALLRIAASRSPTPTPPSSTPRTASPAASPGSTKSCGARGFSKARCLDRARRSVRGQAEEIDRVCRAYPHLSDDEFVAAHLRRVAPPLTRSDPRASAEEAAHSCRSR